MIIFEPTSGNGYEWINCVEGSDHEVFMALDGSSRAADWKPILVRRIRPAQHLGFKPSDFPWLGSWALVMRRKAVDALRDVLEANGEILPLATEDDVELFVYNAGVVDALDEARSTLWRFPESNRIMDLEKPVFFESAIGRRAIFKLPLRASPTYVSEEFVHRVKLARLLGLVFNRVWSSRPSAV